jgi:Pyridoxamine 5'-phosphate oxidase
MPMPLSDTIKTLIRNAWDDGYPCLLATHGREGPNITPKGNMIVFDDAHLAWWERSKRAVLENLSHDKRVCVMYANFKAQRDGVLESGFLRFFGSVELHESGPVREAIFAKLLPREQTHVGRGWHRRAGQDRQGDRYPWQADCVTRGLAPRPLKVPFRI